MINTTEYPKFDTDYGVLMELFIDVMKHQDPELGHKSFVKKITNKIDRTHKRANPSHLGISERRARKAVARVEKATDGVEISIGALCWLIHNKHLEELKHYKFDKLPFEELNKFYKAQGVIMQTARVLTQIEGAMYE